LADISGWFDMFVRFDWNSGSPICFGTRGLGVSFQVQTHKTPLPLPPPSSGRKGLRTGTHEVRRLEKHVLWGCCHICKDEVSFDVAPSARAHGRGQDREPVERPFHNLRTNGLSLKWDSQTSDFWHRFRTRVILSFDSGFGGYVGKKEKTRELQGRILGLRKPSPVLGSTT